MAILTPKAKTVSELDIILSQLTHFYTCEYNFNAFLLQFEFLFKLLPPFFIFNCFQPLVDLMAVNIYSR